MLFLLPNKQYQGTAVTITYHQSYQMQKIPCKQHLAAVAKFTFLFLQTFIHCHQRSQLLQDTANVTKWSQISSQQTAIMVIRTK